MTTAIPVISYKLRKFQKSLLCSTVTVVPCTSEKEHAILVQFETWKLIFVDRKGVIKISTVKNGLWFNMYSESMALQFS
ncbi:hypothetical protein T09_5734 [Trichinella sp. T9]|nr:hypothetical protein T09_5734 [Trichinella sp. T9]